MNDVLFLLIGLEMIIITFAKENLILGGLVIFAVLFGRLVSVGLPITIMRLWQPFERGTIRMMTWGGLRGGLSIAMALSLPEGPEKSVILTLTYVVVLFSIMVQGTSFKRVSKLVLK